MVARSKSLDTPAKLITWLDDQFDAVQSGVGNYAAVLREASLAALRLGAGDLVGPIGDDPTQTETLAALGKLLAWCRSQPDGQLLWDAGEAADRLGLSPRTLWLLTNRKEIPCVRPTAKMVRYSPEALRQWIAEASNRQEDQASSHRKRVRRGTT